MIYHNRFYSLTGKTAAVLSALFGMAVLLVAVGNCAPGGKPPRQTPTSLTKRFSDVATRLNAAINRRNTRAIQQLFAPVMQKAMPEDQTRVFIDGLRQQYGKITGINTPDLSGETAKFRVTFERGTLGMLLTLDRQSKISGLYLVPATEDIPVPERNTISLRLPFADEWTVFWGGATEEQNYHINTRNQRRALDLVIRDAKGLSHACGGTRNEEYFAYGKTILAPAAGEVITVIDGVPDNLPGSMNPYSGVGNCIILRHAEHEFSVLAHLQPGSIQVKPGDKVLAGQELGKCGNSGNSSEPHLHFHLQNSAVLQDGTGFAPYFQNVRVVRNGKSTSQKEHTPLRDERIRPQTGENE